MLKFEPVTIDIADKLLQFVQPEKTRSCDYTPGNLIMWARFMDYRYAIEEDTLFISCKSQNDMKSEAFLPPIGKMELKEAVAILKEYCENTGKELRLTAVPQEFVEELQSILPHFECEELENWSDYVYDIQKLATLQGKALNKKRNRYNKFITEQPAYTYNRCTADDITDVVKFLASNRECQHNREDNMRCYEHWQCMATVRNLLKYEQPAGVLRIDGKITAFTLGEVFNDTLFVHIEKADHNIAGASEAINRLFVNDILAEHPELVYANREEDLGDPGLRQVKRAYNPVMMIQRYEMYKKQ
ncbi:MAG: DUF2156 domain-containing protein [Bacteroidaceae bacterium]|nr:DUF2156 domain-containing protein [Bacteroidaceae bacterium]